MIFRFTKRFTVEFKKLPRKYYHLEEDFDGFLSGFDDNHKTAKTIKANLYKLRIKNSDKTKPAPSSIIFFILKSPKS